jgi:hypothetical protein
MSTPLSQADATATTNVGGPTAQASTEPQAQGAAPAIDLNAFAAQVEERVRNSMFAELRRSGALKESKKAPAPVADAAPSVDLRSLDRALTRSGLGASLSDAAMQRMERAYQAEAPDDATAWVKDYLGGFGVAPTATQPATVSAPAPRNLTPASDGGAPPAPRVLPDEPDLLSASVADRAHYEKVLGPRKFVALYKKQISGLKIPLR